MSTEFATKLMIDQRLADLRHEAELDHLASMARPRRGRWWERLMLSRAGNHDGRRRLASPPRAQDRRSAALAAGDSRC